jgi:putative acetyltransferase
MPEAMISMRPSRAQDVVRAVEIWSAAVDATHDFLDPADRVSLEALIRTLLPTAPLLLAVDSDDHPLAFMLLDGSHMEALFVDPAVHGRGIGALLVREALRKWPEMTTDVNEANHRALGFYEHFGFVRTGRSSLDGQGRPYPLIHLKHAGGST